MNAYRVVIIVPADSVYPPRLSRMDMEQVRSGAAAIVEAARAAIREDS